MNWPSDYPRLPAAERVVEKGSDPQEPGTLRLLRALASHPLKRWRELTPMHLRITNENFRVSLHRLRSYGWRIQRNQYDPDMLRLHPDQAAEIRTWFIDNWKVPGVRETAIKFGFARM